MFKEILKMVYEKLKAELVKRPFLKQWRWIVWDTRCNAVSGMYASRERARKEFAFHMESFPGRYHIVDIKAY